MVKPMLLNEENIPNTLLQNQEQLEEFVKNKFPNWLCQIKYNGERCMVSIKDGKITALRNRGDLPMLQYFPELLEIKFPFKEALLDGEICILDSKEKSRFYNEKVDDKIVQAGIQGRSKSIKDKEFVKKFPVTLVLFDALKIDGGLMINKIYSERYKRLLEIKENLNLIIAKNKEFKEAWSKVKEEDLEGVVLKNPNSLYEIDKRSKNYIKIKNYKTTEIKVDKTEQNDKGVKITGMTPEGLNIECQIPMVDNIEIGSIVKIKYIERIGNKLIQPTKL